MRTLLFGDTPDGRFAGLGLLVLRLGVGLAMAVGHGLGKLEKLIGGGGFADPIGLGATFSLGLAAFAELFCALFIVFGFLTRLAAVPLVVTMLVALFLVHGSDPWSKKELAFMYLVPFVTLLFTGAGRYSLDGYLAEDDGEVAEGEPQR